MYLYPYIYTYISQIACAIEKKAYSSSICTKLHHNNIANKYPFPYRTVINSKFEIYITTFD